MRAEDTQQELTERISIMEVAFIQDTIERADIKPIREILPLIITIILQRGIVIVKITEAIIQVQKNIILHPIILINLTSIILMAHHIQVEAPIKSILMGRAIAEVFGAGSKAKLTLLEKAHPLIITRNLTALTFLREAILQEQTVVFTILQKAIKQPREALPPGQDQEHFLLQVLLQAQAFLPTLHHLLPHHHILLLKREINV